MHHGTSGALLVALYIALTLMPVAIVVFAWRGWILTTAPSTWRKWVALAALLVESIAALAMPVVMLVLTTHSWARWIDRIEIDAMGYATTTGMAASVLAIPLAAFAWGRIRWLALPACLLTLALCIMAGMAMSY